MNIRQRVALLLATVALAALAGCTQPAGPGAGGSNPPAASQAPSMPAGSQAPGSPGKGDY